MGDKLSPNGSKSQQLLGMLEKLLVSLIVNWFLWTLIYIFLITELNLGSITTGGGKGKHGRKIAHLVAYFGGFFLFLKFAVPLLD